VTGVNDDHTAALAQLRLPVNHPVTMLPSPSRLPVTRRARPVTSNYMKEPASAR
jgi:hypothetical protein